MKSGSTVLVGWKTSAGRRPQPGDETMQQSPKTNLERNFIEAGMYLLTGKDVPSLDSPDLSIPDAQILRSLRASAPKLNRKDLTILALAFDGASKRSEKPASAVDYSDTGRAYLDSAADDDQHARCRKYNPS